MNDHWLSITGKVNIPQPLEMDCEYTFMGKIAIYGVNKGSKQDGSFNETFKAKFCEEIYLTKGEKVMQAKDKYSRSQKWRRLIEGKGHDYEKWMRWQFSKFNELEREYEVNAEESIDTDVG